MVHIVAMLLHLAFVPSPEFEAAVQAELNAIYESTPVRFQVMVEREGMHLGAVSDVVYVDASGACIARSPWAGGALASTESVDGVLKPLMTVDCDKLAAYVGYPPAIPKALARVLAHEMLHYLLQEPHHASEGLFRASLSRAKLIDGVTVLRASETNRVKARLTGSL
ncbi:hypothetical protein [uncultured Paludibaculum sp.]|uniref:hypothetical protein n=1 Tax=uncultured Paludibaculum sp. TaxID=1765020 RepID=UPI002AABE52F|nr:hypothetical protein [uncultured Paludibaculum sp.]